MLQFMQAQASALGNPSENSKVLCLLSLDGGGVRGMSTLLVLEQLMRRIDPEKPPNPCDCFDMMGGTSTGGLIAIMLGRLHMSIRDCRNAYRELADEVFQEKNSKAAPGLKWPWNWHLKGRFDSDALERGIKRIVVKALKHLPENAHKSDQELENTLLKEENGKCKVFVTATSASHPDQTTAITSYSSTRWPEDMLDTVTIWQAARATSAASTFFDPISIGPEDEAFVDGATGANNPVNVVCAEARDVWSFDDALENHVQCLVSIGTGVPNIDAFGRSLLEIGRTLKNMATETERTSEDFVREHTRLHSELRYFRFNVRDGLENVGLEEARKRPEIAAATRRYVALEGTKKELESCADNLRLREWFRLSSHILKEAAEERQNVIAPLRAYREAIAPEHRWSIQWFKKFPEYRRWISATPSGHVCYFSNKGTGKTTLLSRILEELYDLEHPRMNNSIFVDLLRCNGVNCGLDLVSVLRSMIYQMIDLNPSKLNSLLYFLIERKINPRKALSDKVTLTLALYQVMPHATEEHGFYIFVDSIDKVSKDVTIDLTTILTSSFTKARNVRIMIVGSPTKYDIGPLIGIPRISPETEVQHCIESLFFPEWQDRKSVVEKPFEHTSDWVFSHQSFIRWVESPGGLLWIGGKPGSGKSTIARRIVEKISANDINHAVVADFFYSTRMGEKTTRHYFMLRSILFQLLRQVPSLYCYFCSFYRSLFESDQDNVDWPMEKLKDIFRFLTVDQTKSRIQIVCVLDAFDESESFQDRTNERPDSPGFLDWLSHLAGQQGQRAWFKLIVLSRPEIAIKRSLHAFLSNKIIVEDHNGLAIESIVESWLQKMKQSLREWAAMDSSEGLQSTSDPEEWNRHADQILDLLKERMLLRADGTIQWVVSVLRELQGPIQGGYYTLESLETTLDSLPKGLENLYKELVNRLRRRLDPAKIIRAKTMLLWVCFTQRPLTLGEFRDALALNGWNQNSSISFQHHLDRNRTCLFGSWGPVERDITDTCGCLLEVVRPASASRSECYLNSLKPANEMQDDHFTVQVTHETVKEFLIRKDGVAGDLALDITESKRKIANELASYVTSSIPMPNLTGPNQISYWDDPEFQTLSRHLEDRPLLHYIIRFFWKYHCNEETWRIFADFSSLLQQQKSYSEHGWCLLEGWLPFGTREDAEGRHFSFTLESELDARSLSQLQGWLTLRVSSRKDCTIFSVKDGREHIDQCLLSSGFFQERNIRGELGRSVSPPRPGQNTQIHRKKSTSGVSRASSWSMKGEVPSSPSTSDFGEIIPPLFKMACQCGHISVLRLILEHFELPTEDFLTGFREALKHNESAVRWMESIFLARFRDRNFAEEMFSAAARNRAVSLNVILKTKTSPNTFQTEVLEGEHRPGVTPLHLAAENGAVEAVKCLLDWKARSLPDMKKCRTPLMLAALNSSPEVVSLLLHRREHSDSTDRKDRDGHTALFLAMKKVSPVGWRDTTMNLRRARITGQNVRATILHLLMAGASPYEPNDAGKTPLDIALEKKNPEILALLASCDFNSGRCRRRRVTVTGDPNIFNQALKLPQFAATGLARPYLSRHPSFPGHELSQPPFICLGFRHRPSMVQGNPYRGHATVDGINKEGYLGHAWHPIRDSKTAMARSLVHLDNRPVSDNWEYAIEEGMSVSDYSSSMERSTEWGVEIIRRDVFE